MKKIKLSKEEKEIFSDFGEAILRTFYSIIGLVLWIISIGLVLLAFSDYDEAMRQYYMVGDLLGKVISAVFIAHALVFLIRIVWWTKCQKKKTS